MESQVSYSGSEPLVGKDSSGTLTGSGGSSYSFQHDMADAQLAGYTPTITGMDSKAYGGLFDGYNERSIELTDYSSYLRSLNGYCGRYGFDMPEVTGTDYRSAFSAYESVNSQWQAANNAPAVATKTASEADVYYNIIPIVYPDGSVVFDDANGHGAVSAMKMPNGLYHLSGPKSLVTAIGGRGEWDTVVRHMSDGNYWNDR